MTSLGIALVLALLAVSVAILSVASAATSEDRKVADALLGLWVLLGAGAVIACLIAIVQAAT